MMNRRQILLVVLTCTALLVSTLHILYCGQCNTRHEGGKLFVQLLYSNNVFNRSIPLLLSSSNKNTAAVPPLLVQAEKGAMLEAEDNITISINSTRKLNSYNQDTINDTIDMPHPSTTVQLVISVDMDQLVALIPLLQSIKAHNDKGHTRINIHIVVSTNDRPSIENRVTCAIKMPLHIKIQFIIFDVPDSFRQLIKVESHEYLSSTANFARFFFAELFPSLSHILYIDVDTIVKCNISKLWSEVIQANEELLVVVPRKLPKYYIHFPYGNITDLFYTRYNRVLDLDSDSFNAGVAGFNLNKWRRNKLSEEVLYWMKENYKSSLWFQGTQPVLYLVAYQDWRGVDKCWNVDGLGWTSVPAGLVRNGCILHWSGPVKPWTTMSQILKLRKKKPSLIRRGKYNGLWKKYNINKKNCSKR